MTDKIINTDVFVGGDELLAADLVDSIEGVSQFTTANLLAAVIDGITTTNQTNLLNDPLTSTSNIDTGNTTAMYSADDDVYYFCSIFDEFDDASVDTNRWSSTTGGTGTVTETGGYIQLSHSLGVAGTATLLSDGGAGQTTPLDFKSFSGNSEFIFRYDAINTGGSATVQMQLSDGTNHVTLVSAGTGTTGDIVRVVINKSGETVDVYKGDTTVTSDDVDISSLVGSNWYFRLNFSGDTSPASHIRIHFLGYIDGTSTTSDVVTAAQTPSSNASLGICNSITSVGSFASGELAFSADNGSTYVTGNNREWIRTTVAGTNCKYRFRNAHSTSPSATSKNIVTMSKYAFYYI